MGVYTNIEFRNANDPEFQKAVADKDGERQEWEYENGSIHDRPGALIKDTEDVVAETDDEYGGWVIAVADIPNNATHIVIHRG